MSYLRLSALGSFERPGNLVVYAQFDNATAVFRPELNPNELASIQSNVRKLKSFVESSTPSMKSADFEEIGIQLFDFLIGGDVKILFDQATGSLPDKDLPVEVMFEDAELASWPWEFAYNKEKHLFIVQNFNPLSRNILSHTGVAVNQKSNTLPRVLVLVGVQPSDPEIKWSEEVELLKQIFGGKGSNFEVVQASEIDALAHLLNGSKFYDVVHFIGHASFDYQKRTGYLVFERGTEKIRVKAQLFASLLTGSRTRLVFLNACKSGVGDFEGNIARTSVAAALLDRGVGAVVGTQFTLPERTAQLFASSVYNNLLSGNSIADAVRRARVIIQFGENATDFDWAVPSLYCRNPNGKLFNGEDVAVADVRAGADAVPIIKNAAAAPRVKVLLIDIDTDAGYLASLCERANEVQDYYSFQVEYFPIPSGYTQTPPDFDPQTHLPRLMPIFKKAEEDLEVDFICGITRNMISTEPNGDDPDTNLIAAKIPDTRKSSAVSTFGLREYAALANVEFSKSVLSVVLSIVLFNDPRWELEYHDETVGCLFDKCIARNDLVVGLRKMKFDHLACREKITDDRLLEAIDAIALI